ncbi:MAG: hypothetical protein U0519_03760 [Candidatus Gracilibacteria bacterium]
MNVLMFYEDIVVQAVTVNVRSKLLLTQLGKAVDPVEALDVGATNAVDQGASALKVIEFVHDW